MKTLSARLLLLPVLLLGATVACAKKTPKEPDNRPALAIVISEALPNQGSAFTDFDRLDIAFQEVAKKRNWPMKPVAEQYAANTPDHEIEVTIFNQPLRRDEPAEFTYRGWMTLTVKGKKYDFGIVQYRHNIRIGENMSDTLDKVYLGAAYAAAAKIEPILFPDLNKK